MDREETARLAHSIWEKAGRPEGRSDEFWLLAEKILFNGNRLRDYLRAMDYCIECSQELSTEDRDKMSLMKYERPVCRKCSQGKPAEVYSEYV